MNHRPDPAECSDDTKKITVLLPCQLAERAERYAKENGNTITGVVIEALDTFLRGEKLDLSGW
jgi:hypothetical protein